jgi:hypothetical protein
MFVKPPIRFNSKKISNCLGGKKAFGCLRPWIQQQNDEKSILYKHLQTMPFYRGCGIDGLQWKRFNSGK